MVTASWDNTARVWEAATGKAIGEPLRHERKVNSAAFSPDGKFVVTASWDGRRGYGRRRQAKPSASPCAMSSEVQ